MRSVFLDPGTLRNEFSLQAPSLNPDGQGGHSEIWSEIGTVFARIEPVQAQSRFGAGQTLETTTHRITLRWRADVTSGRRFVRLGRVFEILTVQDPDETGRYLICLVRETGL